MSNSKVVRDDQNRVVLPVAGKSNPNKVATAIARFLDEGESVALKAIGAGAVNQAVKSLTAARGLVATAGIDLAFTTGFVREEIGGEVRTAIKFNVIKRTP